MSKTVPAFTFRRQFSLYKVLQSRRVGVSPRADYKQAGPGQVKPAVSRRTLSASDSASPRS
ncbi:hypothetical protein HaLaN_18016 [Haematococcus lacustris]|uniref:Uncharacterized protein n=1 Tax=Haematococcus lacustris TaxID=44745 RepID=A0A699ZDP5_HAELA|nr:hypothetical protein HaLaN_18016 [Haematococcus lacustris]